MFAVAYSLLIVLGVATISRFDPGSLWFSAFTLRTLCAAGSNSGFSDSSSRNLVGVFIAG